MFPSLICLVILIFRVRSIYIFFLMPYILFIYLFLFSLDERLRNAWWISDPTRQRESWRYVTGNNLFLTANWKMKSFLKLESNPSFPAGKDAWNFQILVLMSYRIKGLNTFYILNKYIIYSDLNVLQFNLLFLSHYIYQFLLIW